MNLPFADGAFDVVYSIGVLHHTPDTKWAFLSLSRLVKPGGRIAIWVYSTILRLMFGGELLRMITPRLPKPLLLRASKVAIPLYHVHRLPLVGRLSTALFPTSINPDRSGAGWTPSTGIHRGISGSTRMTKWRAGSGKLD